MSNFVGITRMIGFIEYIKAGIRYKVSAGPSLGESEREILHGHLVKAVKLLKEARKEVAKMTDTMRQVPMEAEVWSGLQDYIPLQLVYEKLSRDDLFRLRLVSKEWNHATLQRVLPKNSFVTIITWTRSEGEDWDDHYLNGVVTYDVNAHTLTFHKERFRLRPKERHVPPFEVEGLILCHHPDNMQERGVFNVHTQTWHVIPEAPNKSDTISVCGLIVDTMVKPFTFKLIEGFLDIATQIYDSQTKTWSITSSQLQGDYENPVYDGEYTCVCRNGTVYISVHENDILKYSMIDDLWTTLEFPAVHTPTEHNTLGVREGRIFTVRESLEEQRVTVWEIVDEETQEWVEYARMPEELYQWMFEHDFPFAEDDDHDEQFECNYLRTFFRDGYVLFCCFWTWYTATADALVLFNIATKEWRKVDLPMIQYVCDPDDQYFEYYEYLYRSGYFEDGVVEDDDDNEEENGDAEENEEDDEDGGVEEDGEVDNDEE